MKNYIFIVEGSHDVTLIGSILKVLKFKPIKKSNELKSVLKKLIIDKFPFEGDSLNIFNKIPSFYKKGEDYICIVNANGEDNLLKRLDLNLERFELEDYDNITKIILFCDADTKNKEEKLKSILDVSFDDFIFKKQELIDGNIILKDFDITSIPSDFYVLPDNQNQGRLEEILMEVIRKKDYELLERVDKFLKEIPEKYKTKWTGENSSYDKTLISCIGNIKVPGSAMSTFIEKAKWIKIDTIEECVYLNCIYVYIKNQLKA